MSDPFRLDILTFVWHEAYLCMLAETGHRFYAVQVEKGGHYGWQESMRPLPENVRLLKEADALAMLRDGSFHLALCHNLRDILFIESFDIPKILVFHNKISTEVALGGHRFSVEGYRQAVADRLARKDLTLVFISEAKRENCGLDGPVILPGINLRHYGDYRGDVPRVLRVGNLMKERDLMLGFSWQEEILRGFPSTILGINPTVSGSKVSRSWDDLKGHYRSHRLFLNGTLHPWEDGYNLAMLEAMATGMPVVSLANVTSPLVDGVNGYISQDPHYLRGRIAELLADRERAEELGRKGRETVEKQFPLDRFVERWNGVLEGVVNRSARVARGLPRARREERGPEDRGKAGKKVLLCYTSNPVTTARYLDESLRASHDVITCGPSISRDQIQAWDLGNMKENPRPHDFSSESVHVKRVFDAIGAGWRPDFFLWIETGIWFPLDGLEHLDCPKVCYLIDTHHHLDLHLQWARQFDVVFLAQKAYVSHFRKAGIENVFWLPLACDPRIHGKRRVKKRYDIGFVGSLTPADPKRAVLLGRLSRRFHVHVERCFLKDMARVFSASRIVFNHAIRDDLNMRVFEALCSGSLLLTDRAGGSGIEALFQDRTHLVLYEEETLEDLAGYFLDHEDEREFIAIRGRREVLSKHTYRHRVEEIVRRVEHMTESGVFRFPPPEKREKQGPAPANGPSGTPSFEAPEELEERGCLIEARDLYLERLERNPLDAAPLVGLGRIAMQFGHWEEAEAYLRRAVELEPRWESLVLLARCEMRRGELAQALVRLETAGRSDGGNTLCQNQVHMTMGECLMRMGRHDQAEACYRRVLLAEGGSGEAWTGLGLLHTMKRDYLTGAEAFRKAVAIDPENDRALCGLGISLWEAGETRGGFEAFRRSLEINPENRTALGHLLGCSRGKEELELVEKYLRRYLEFHPLNVEVLWHLGGLCYRLGRYDEVREIVETIRMVQPDHEGARDLASFVPEEDRNGDQGRGTPGTFSSRTGLSAWRPSSLDTREAEGSSSELE